jgi:hypothetical protein
VKERNPGHVADAALQLEVGDVTPVDRILPIGFLGRKAFQKNRLARSAGQQIKYSHVDAHCIIERSTPMKFLRRQSYFTDQNHLQGEWPLLQSGL